MKKGISLIAHDQKRLYTGFLAAAVLLFVLTSLYTEFNPMTLVRNGDAFWSFITEDFLPPALPKASRIPGVLSSVLVTLALAMHLPRPPPYSHSLWRSLAANGFLHFQKRRNSSEASPPF